VVTATSADLADVWILKEQLLGCGTLRRVIVMRPVLEIYAPDGFDLWPVAEVQSFAFSASQR
jgi:hypothetical protein